MHSQLDHDSQGDERDDSKQEEEGPKKGEEKRHEEESGDGRSYVKERNILCSK